MTSYISKLFGSSAAASTASPEIEPGSSPENLTTMVEGTVTDRKFESILIHELFSRKEGESTLKAGAIAVLSLVTGLFILVGLYDLVRYGLFKAGACDGKSWSLIDKASEGVKQLSAKVDAAVASQKKELTPEQQNAQSEAAMKTNVAKIVQGYKNQNNSFFHSNQLFSAPAAIEGEQAVRSGQANLAWIISDYVARNATKAEEIPALLNGINEHIRGLFNEIGKNDLFIINKTRYEKSPLISEFGFSEFLASIKGDSQQGILHPIAGAFLSQVDKDYAADQARVLDGTTLNPSVSGVSGGSATTGVVANPSVSNLVRNLAAGVQHGILTPDQATQKLIAKAKDVYAQAIADVGPKNAPQAIDSFVQECLNNGLVEPGQEEQLKNAITLTPKELAAAVAKNIAQYRMQNPGMKPAAIDQKIANAAQELKKQQKLLPEDEVEFVNEVKAQLDAAQADIEARAQGALKAHQEAQAAAEQKAKLEVEAAAAAKAKEEADALAEVERVKEIERIAREKQNLFDVLKNMLSNISEKQKELLRRYGVYDAQALEKAQMVDLYNFIRQATVEVGKDKKPMTVLQAINYRTQKIAEIHASHKTPDRIIADIAQFDEDFGADAIAVINELNNLEGRLDEQTQAMNRTLKMIRSLDTEIEKDLATYRKFYTKEKKKLDLDQKKEIKTLAKAIEVTQVDLTARYRKVNDLSPFANKPAVEGTEVNVEEYLKALQPAPTPSISNTLWNGITYPLRAVGLI